MLPEESAKLCGSLGLIGCMGRMGSCVRGWCGSNSCVSYVSLYNFGVGQNFGVGWGESKSWRCFKILCGSESKLLCY